MLIILIILAIVLFWVYKKRSQTKPTTFSQDNIDRGKRTVMACQYLKALDCGYPIIEANDLCGVIFSPNWDQDQLRQSILRAQHEVDTVYGGKQLPLIQFATERGFEH